MVGLLSEAPLRDGPLAREPRPQPIALFLEPICYLPPAQRSRRSRRIVRPNVQHKCGNTHRRIRCSAALFLRLANSQNPYILESLREPTHNGRGTKMSAFILIINRE